MYSAQNYLKKKTVEIHKSQKLLQKGTNQLSLIVSYFVSLGDNIQILHFKRTKHKILR
jgi:hypothetical protein